MKLLTRKFKEYFDSVTSWKEVAIYLIYAICYTTVLIVAMNLGVNQFIEVFE